ncbi:formate dehydrogenase subunit gamma [Lentisalinibacter sediminis]|uniref:formate dehydrogenase subunit gamma n=1 Tax=Lentisalinibacter sediminis TaxID=2992237 RepID=UPI00386B1309
MAARQLSNKSRRRRIMLTVVLSSLFAMALPLIGYVVHDAGFAFAQSAADSDDGEVNPRAEYWRAVREGTEGYSAVSGRESGVLIQNGGENWQEVRNGPVTFLGASLIIAAIIALAAKHIVLGGQKLSERTGRTITRWSAFERTMHWFVAISFIILSITGLSLIFGRAVLIPLLGKEGFAAWAQIAKPVHDYLAVPFAIGLAVILLMWLPKNLFKSYDLTWLKSAGGFFGDGHPPAGFANAGEKIFFWLLFFGGIALTISGFYLLFPNLGWERSTMQLAHIVHAGSGLILIAIALGHMYLGSLGVEGSFEGMVTGEVDETFAKEHHSVWYDEVKHGTSSREQGLAPGASTATQA